MSSVLLSWSIFLAAFLLTSSKGFCTHEPKSRSFLYALHTQDLLSYLEHRPESFKIGQRKYFSSSLSFLGLLKISTISFSVKLSTKKANSM